MYTNIIPILRCPHCGAELELVESRTEDGIKEAARVLKPGAPLVNSAVYMDETADGAQGVIRFLGENGMAGAEKMFIRRELLAVYGRYFPTVQEKIICEGTAEGAEADPGQEQRAGDHGHRQGRDLRQGHRP